MDLRGMRIQTDINGASRCEGVRQGDPFATPLFCLFIQDIDIDLSFFFWYLLKDIFKISSLAGKIYELAHVPWFSAYAI
jgi:hypothetical protein